MCTTNSTVHSCRRFVLSGEAIPQYRHLCTLVDRVCRHSLYTTHDREEKNACSCCYIGSPQDCKHGLPAPSSTQPAPLPPVSCCLCVISIIYRQLFLFSPRDKILSSKRIVILRLEVIASAATRIGR